jgi:Zn-dependent peptidase ImmA (M78 family)/transcriptional regulator with XRE-family HTH domain
MADIFNGDLLRIARQFRGFNQKDLAEALSLEPSSISRAENEVTPPGEPMVARIADFLRFPISFFHQPDRIYGMPISAHPMWRKRKSVAQRDTDQILAEINIRILHLRRLLRSLEFSPQLPLPRYEVEDYGGDIEEIAIMVRRTWMLPAGPLANLTAVIEMAGVFVFYIDLERSDVDGLTMRPPGLPPCIFLNRALSADRMRFTLAHELAHIILHKFPVPEMEDEANHFAGALLVPHKDVHSYFSGQKIDLRLLARLKPQWRVSMQNLLYRAKALEYLSEEQAKYLWRQFSHLKMRIREPAELDFAPEEPTLVPRLFSLHQTNLKYNMEDMQSMLCMYVDDIRDLYGIRDSKPTLRIVT